MSNEMLEAALAYAKRGWPIFSVRADKTPYTQHGVQDATTDEKKIKAMWALHPHANIALNVGELHEMVLDLDPGFDMKELVANVGQIPRTGLFARTPRGGLHLHYEIGVDEVCAASASKLAPHCDVRSFHSYILLPPSRTKDGVYIWEGEACKQDGSHARPAFRTDDMLRLANSGREKHRDHDTWIIEADLHENVENCIRWLKGETELPCKIAIEGQGGDQCAYDTAAMCKSFGISQELAFDLMWDHWNPRCLPPWGPDEIDHFETKIENGYRYNTSPPGNVTPAYRTAKSAALFATVELEELERGNQWTRGHFRGVDRAGMSSIAPPSWLVDNFLPENAYAMLFGNRSTFKTFIALDLALSIAAGICHDPTWDIVRSGPTCFVAGEGRSGALKRVRAWEKIHWGGYEVDDFVLVDPVPNIQHEPELFLQLLEDISPDGYKLIVLDTVGRAMQGVNENAQEYASAFTALVETIQKATGACVLALHHTGHSHEKRARGSSVFGADIDTEIRVEAQDRIVTLAMTKQKDAEEWAVKKQLKLIEVSLDPSTKSLVCVLPTEEDVKAAVQLSDKETIMLLDTVEEVALDILYDRQEVAFSQRALADEIACDERITCGSEQIRKKYLTNLREENARQIAKCYYARTQRWHWVD